MSDYESENHPYQSASHFYEPYDYISDMVQMITQDGKFIFVNKAWCEALGYTKQEINELNVFNIIHPNQHNHCSNILQRLMSGETVGLIETSFLTKDGHIIVVEGHITSHVVQGETLATCGIFRDITNRVAIEKEIRAQNKNLNNLITQSDIALQINEQRYHDFIANVPGAVYEFVIDSSGNRSFSYVSEGIIELLGFQPEECVADIEIIFRNIRADSINAMEESIRESWINLSTWLHEFPVTTSTGVQKWLRGHSSPKREADGTVRWSGVLIDITERKLIERSLQTITDRLSLATRASGVGIWDWDICSNRLTWDESMFTIFGISKDKFTHSYEDWRRTVHPEDLPQTELEIQNVLTGEKKNLDMEFRIVRSDGTVCNIAALAALQFDDYGQPVRMTGTNIDITKQKKNEYNLWVAKEKAEQLSNELIAYIEAIGQLALVSITDIEGNITHVNTKFCEISGYSETELLGKNHRILNSSIHSKEFFEMMWATIKFGNTWHAEICNRNKNDQHYWLESTIVPLRNKNNIIINYLSVSVDITERKSSELHILKMATHDELTELPNRYLLLDRITQVLAHDQRAQKLAAVLFIDLDHFKAINDALGHDIGDSVLKEVAKRLLSTVRSEDTVARQGGDEFIVLLSTIADNQYITAIAQKIINVLRQPYHIDGNDLFIGASIGISLYPSDGKDADTLLKNSDIAMYHAKTGGRNNFRFFDSEMNLLALERQALSADLYHAIEHNELELYFQPIVDMSSTQINSLEILTRWNHPRLGFISPLKFIPLAEEIGLIVPIGEWVLRQACLQIQTWKYQGYQVPKLSINVSTRQFQKRTLVNDFKIIMRENHVDASHFILEITETALVKNIDEMVVMLHELNELGFEISIDDFGTGYSSLGYLKCFPIHALKIDRTFIQNITSDPDDAAICAAIIALGHSLGLKLIAEGVETKEQIDFLLRQGCNHCQGYYFYQPISQIKITDILFKKC